MKTEFDTEMPDVSLVIPQSSEWTKDNNTGSWRFVRPDYQDKTAPCSVACPLGTDIPNVEMQLSKGMLHQAWETILMENPFPATCGRVCYHPCEEFCNRKELDLPIAINQLERFLGDSAISERIPSNLKHKEFNGRRILIGGSGPAGLSAAYFLTRLGYSCDIYEADCKAGGILQWGIPEYRLPKAVLHKEIQRIQGLGVQLYLNSSLTKRVLTKMKKKVDAVFLGFGLTESIKMNIPGEELVLDGLKFLHQSSAGSASPERGTVAVIGGGNTAIDVARSVARLGGKPLIVYRRRKEDMPAFSLEIADALEEGIDIMELAAPISVERDHNTILLKLQKMKPGKKDSTGRTGFIPNSDKTQIIRVSKVISGIGATNRTNEHPVEGASSQTVQMSHCHITLDDIPIVYGGDMVNNIQSVTDAIASGKQAAIALDTYFAKGVHHIEDSVNACRVGDGASLSMDMYLNGSRKNRAISVVESKEINMDYFQAAERVRSDILDASVRAEVFNEYIKTLAKEQAIKESQRCFNCGVCNECDNCRLFCPDVAVLWDADGRRINYDYCKGCGICVAECPRNAMTIGEETV